LTEPVSHDDEARMRVARAVHLPEKPRISLLRKIQGARLIRELDPVSNDLIDKDGLC